MATSFGRWEIIRPLDEGGQAWTYLVQDSEKRICVLKRLKNVKRLERFRVEFETLKNTDDRSVVAIIDADLTAEKPYYVMEYCEGGSLDSRDHQLTLRDKLLLFETICVALGRLHERGITHRDIKPSNILLRANRLSPVLADFGLCYVEDGERHTLTEEAIGARHYMAPELEAGRANVVGPAVDVYSLGKLLYWLLAGRVFPRERHSDPIYDLRSEAESPFDANFMASVYGLLDATVAEDPGIRIPNGVALARNVRHLIQQLDFRYHRPGVKIAQHCNYCGIGSYKPIAQVKGGKFPGHDPMAAANFGFAQKSGWLILVCTHCANVQSFKVDAISEAPGRWGIE